MFLLTPSWSWKCLFRTAVSIEPCLPITMFLTLFNSCLLEIPVCLLVLLPGNPLQLVTSIGRDDQQQQLQDVLLLPELHLPQPSPDDRTQARNMANFSELWMLWRHPSIKTVSTVRWKVKLVDHASSRLFSIFVQYLLVAADWIYLVIAATSMCCPLKSLIYIFRLFPTLHWRCSSNQF